GMIAPRRAGRSPIDFDQWDGPDAARERLLGFVKDEGIDDVVVLTGDIHTSWASDVPMNDSGYDRTAMEGSILTEFVTPAVTSPGIPGLDETIINPLRPQFPHIQYVELSHRGYIVLDVTRDRVQGDYYHLDGILEGEGNEFHAASWRVSSGHPYMIEEDFPIETCEAAPLAP